MVQTLEVEGITNTGSRTACQLSSCLPVTMYMTMVVLLRKVIWATPLGGEGVEPLLTTRMCIFLLLGMYLHMNAKRPCAV